MAGSPEDYSGIIKPEVHFVEYEGVNLTITNTVFGDGSQIRSFETPETLKFNKAELEADTSRVLMYTSQEEGFIAPPADDSAPFTSRCVQTQLWLSERGQEVNLEPFQSPWE